MGATIHRIEVINCDSKRLAWKPTGRIESNRHSWELRNDSPGPNLSQSRSRSSDDRPRGPSWTCQSLSRDFSLQELARSEVAEWHVALDVSYLGERPGLAIVISLPLGRARPVGSYDRWLQRICIIRARDSARMLREHERANVYTRPGERVWADTYARSTCGRIVQGPPGKASAGN